MRSDILSLVWCLGLTLLAYAIGATISRRKASNESDAPSCCALGFGILSHLMLGLGIVGGYRRSIVVGMLAVCGLFTWRSLYRGLAAVGPVWRQWRPVTAGERWLVGGVAVMAGLMFLGAFTPPFFNDTLVYHLTLPKRYLAAGRLVFEPMFLSNMPQGIEMLYLLGMIVYRDTVGLLCNAVLGLLCVAVLVSMAREQYRSTAIGWWAALLFLSIPVGVWYQSFSGKINLGLYLYGLLAMRSFLTWERTHEPTALWRCGLWVGFAASVKYVGLYAVPMVIVLVCWAAWQHRVAWRRPMALLVAGGLLTGLPWYLKNWWMTGNPVWPMFYPWLGGREWNAAAHEFFSRHFITSGFPTLGTTLWSWFTGPIQLHLRQLEFFAKGGIGPMLALLVPVSIFDRERATRWILVGAVVFYTCWFGFAHDGMYLMPVVALLCLPAASAGCAVWAHGGRVVRVGVAIIMAGWLLVSGAALVERTYAFAGAAWNETRRAAFLRDHVSLYDAIAWLNAALPPGAVVMSTTPLSRYYADFTVMDNGSGFVDYGAVETVEQLRERLRHLGVTHVLLSTGGTMRAEPWMGRRARELIGQLVATDGQRVYEHDGAMILSSVLRRQEPVRVTVYAIR